MPYNVHCVRDKYYQNNFDDDEKQFILHELDNLTDEIQAKCEHVSYIKRFYGNKSESVVSLIKHYFISYGYNVTNGVSQEIIISWA